MALDKDGFEYTIDLNGNAAEQLQLLAVELANQKKLWAEFRRSVVGLAASASAVSSSMSKVAVSTKETAEASGQAAVTNAKLNREQKELAKVSRILEREQKRLLQTRTAELVALQQRTSATQPDIIAKRAEARAARQVSAALERQQIAQERLKLAKAAGITLSATGAKVFDAEAEAIRRIAIAKEKLAVAEAIHRKGYDPSTLQAFQERDTGGRFLTKEETSQRRAQVEFDRQIESARFRKQVEDLKANSAEWRALTGETRRTAKETKVVSQEMETLQGRVNRVAFTFRRLFGILAAFTIARQIVQQFNNMLRAGIEFNRVLEGLEISMAGLFVAAGQVYNSVGQAVSGQEAFSVASGIAREQLRKLQKDAQETAGTFDDLAKAFTTAVAPGLQAGLTVDQIRKITIQISQAATGLGLAQDQLAEEIRSLLQGTITPRTTRIATALGITNQDIRNAERLGNLFDFLQERFEGISLAGSRLIRTFNAELTNMQDAFRQILAVASTGFFDELKGLFRDLRLAVQQTTEDIVVVDPGALKLFQKLFDGLAVGVRGIREAFRSIDLEGVGEIFGLIGSALGVAASAGARLVSILSQISGPTLKLFSLLLDTVQLLLSVLDQVLRREDLLIGPILKWTLSIGFAAKSFGFIADLIEKIGKGIKLLANLYLVQTATQAAAVGKSFLTLKGILSSLALLWTKLLLPLVAIVAGVSAIYGLVNGKGAFSFFKDMAAALDVVLEKLGLVEVKIQGFSDIQGPAGLVSQSVRSMTTELTRTAEEMEKRMRELAISLKATLLSLGADTAVRSQVKSYYDNIKQSEEELNEILRRRTTFSSTLVKEEEKLKSIQRQKEQFSKQIEDYRNQIDALSEIEGLEVKILAFGQAKFRLDKERSQLLNQEPSSLRAETERQEKIQGVEQKTREFLDASEKALQRKSDLQRLVSNQSEEERISRERVQRLLQQEDQTQVNISAIKNSLVGVEKLIANYRKQSADEAAKELAISAIMRNEELRRAQASLILSEASARASAAAIAGQDQGALEVIQARTRLIEKQIQSTETEFEYKRSIQAVQQILTDLESKGLKNSLGYLEAQKEVLLLKENQTLELKNQSAELEVIQAELEQLLRRRSDNFIGGIGDQLEAFARENQFLYQAGTVLGEGLTEGLASFAGDAVSQAIVAAVDPNQNFDLANAFGQFALQLGAQLVTELTKVLIAKLIAGVLDDVKTGVDTGGEAAAAAATATAATQLGLASAALISGAKALGATSTQLGIAAGILNTAATAWAGIAADLMVAAFLLAGSGAGGVGGATGGKVRHWGVEPGFAKGGSLSGRLRIPLRRPSNLDPRDVIPIWARPGEWMIRPESASRYGDRVMAAINSGRIDPALLKSLAAVSSRSSSKRVTTSGPGYASGGRVAGQMPNKTTSDYSEGPQNLIIQTVQFNDEQTLDQALAAGPRAMNRFFRDKRSMMQSALGLKGNSRR